MSPLAAVWKAVDAAIAIGGFAGKVAKRVEKLFRRWGPDHTQSMPLAHKDAERIAAFGRNAGHENEKKPSSSSRYD